MTIHEKTSIRLTPDLREAIEALIRDGMTQSAAMRTLMRLGAERLAGTDVALRQSMVREGIALGLQRLKHHLNAALDSGVIGEE